MEKIAKATSFLFQLVIWALAVPSFLPAIRS